MDKNKTNLKEDNEKHCKKEEKDYSSKNCDKMLKELETKIENLNKEINEHKTKESQYLSTASYYKNEAENCKKDFERYKERNKTIEIDEKMKANEEVALKLLPVIDNFDQAISHVDADTMKGFSMIYVSLTNVLSDLGIVEIKCAGEMLNGEYHNCISTEPTDDETKEGMIATVYQKGYKFADINKVVRTATVSVYKK